MSRELQTFPVSAGLLEPKHVQAIGGALWVYLWFLNRVTRDEQRGDDDFVGIVLNGRSVRIEEIASELGTDDRACRRYLTRLVERGYIERKKTGVGMFTYAVKNSKKWSWKRRTAGARNQSSTLPEKQGNLFPSTARPTDHNLVSGSGDPQTKKLSQGTGPQTTFLYSTDQKVVCAERGSRARSQETTKNETTHAVPASECPALDEWVPRIAAVHPGLDHLKDIILPPVYADAIIEAIVRDTPELVMAGTCNLRDAVSNWPREERRFIPNPVKFYQQREYLRDPAVWNRTGKRLSSVTGWKPPERLPADYEAPSERVKRERAAVAVIQ